jgi:hypothetical protein
MSDEVTEADAYPNLSRKLAALYVALAIARVPRCVGGTAPLDSRDSAMIRGSSLVIRCR